MTEISDDNSHTNSGYSPTVGERLRLAREAKKITISEVVVQLRLTKDNIVYLESDQWDKLHGRPYARGYFSSYVNFLGLPHAEMLALFNMEYSLTEPSIDSFRRSGGAGSEGSAWFKSLLLIVALVAAAWFGYQYWLEIQDQAQQSDAAANSTFLGIENEQAVNDSFGNSIVEPLPAIETEQIIVTESESVIEIPAVEERAIEQQTNEPADALLEQDTSEVIEGAELIQPVQQDELVSNDDTDFNTNEQEIVTETKMLVMQFSKDCWVEISDRNNKKLLHKMVLAGETIELTGKWPLHALLGNALAVKVSYDNNEFDLASYTRSNVARFSVGGTSE
ncbi:MAG: helix-turn-helix domain-containing protein [Methylophaga sp.]|nr:helix-turn-helix domain-containing protein [Methylophaga sp.]